jgi:GT2 family glycosyltransferase
MSVGVVVIGRNEGERLKRCLASVAGAGPVVYVDSGSTDGSVEHARSVGAEVVALDMSTPFTAARARNAGAACLETDLIQFIDGDCEMAPGWIAAGQAFLETRPEVAVVVGHLRERHPEASIYNRLCAWEWDTPMGEGAASGGIALMRRGAFEAVGGFDPDLIAGEEPEMCFRMRAAGWRIWKIDAEMAVHDAAMTRFAQFWKRAQRGGFAWAQGAAMHGKSPERYNVKETRRILLWGAGLPGVVVLGALFGAPILLGLLLAYPLQVARLAVRHGGDRVAWERALLLVVGKLPEAYGALTYLARRLRGSEAQLIEYK